MNPRRALRETTAEIDPPEDAPLPVSDWAENNRIVCDFFHRRIVRTLLPRQLVREWEISDWRQLPRSARAGATGVLARR
jgi:hypothetical protein